MIFILKYKLPKKGGYMFWKIVTLVSAFFIVSFAQTQHAFVGTQVCGMCHKSEKQGSQLKIWEKSSHAKAYETLKTAKADELAKAKGFTTPAVETPECLKCHVSGYGVDASLLGKKFKMEDGVQCETCHGAGEDYKSKKIMENKDEAIKNGLKVPEKIEEFCINCHNAESPTYVDFNFAEMWDKIKHDIPKK